MYDDDLWMLCSNNITDLNELIQFDKIPYTREHEAMYIMSGTLNEKYGANMDKAPAKIYRNKAGNWKLRLQPNSTIMLSDGLKFVLGLLLFYFFF